MPSPNDKWRLAMIAAPFVAAGQSERDALDGAYHLVSHAAFYLKQKRELLTPEQLYPFAVKYFTLTKVCGDFGIKRPATIRKYLDGVEVAESAKCIWRKALKGEPAFSNWVVNKMHEYRDRIHAERQRRAAAGRKKNVVN
jgi:hypothetical protein